MAFRAFREQHGCVRTRSDTVYGSSTCAYRAVRILALAGAFSEKKLDSEPIHRRPIQQVSKTWSGRRLPSLPWRPVVSRCQYCTAAVMMRGRENGAISWLIHSRWSAPLPLDRRHWSEKVVHTPLLLPAELLIASLGYQASSYLQRLPCPPRSVHAGRCLFHSLIAKRGLR